MGDVRDAGLVGKIQSLWPGVFVAGVNNRARYRAIEFLPFIAAARRNCCADRSMIELIPLQLGILA